MAKLQCNQPLGPSKSQASGTTDGQGLGSRFCGAEPSPGWANRRRWLKQVSLGGITTAMWGLSHGESAFAGPKADEPPASDAKPKEAPKSLEERCAAELETLRSKNSLVGLVAGAFDAEGRSVVQAVGLRKQGGDQPILSDDKLHLGSCTKAMTATLIAMAVDRGELKWESTLGEIFVDDLALKESPWVSTTIDDLLHHTSGLPANANWDQLDQKSTSPIEQRAELLQWIAKQKLKKDAKGKFLYSNVGYATLGHVLEQLWKRSWEEIIQERLFKPLGITSAGFGPPDSEASGNQPWGHRNLLLMWDPVNFDNPQSLGPAGRVHMTIRDWAKFALLHATRPKSDGLISVDSWEHIHKPFGKSNYAGGWIVFSRLWAKDEALMHNGSNTTWYCVAWIAPKIERVFLAATNGYSPRAEVACDRSVGWLIQAVEEAWKD